MKTIKLFFAVVLLATMVSCSNNSTETSAEVNGVSTTSVDYTIDTAASIVNWKGSMVGMYAHTGSLKFSEGTISIADGKIISGKFTVDMMSMLTTDDDALYKMAPREKLIQHLQADDFFSAASFPTASFEILSSENNAIKGNLTIKGMTNQVELSDLVLSETDGRFTASGKLIFDRQKFGVSYKSTMKDMVLADDIELEISLSGNKK